ncbi:hypothetical protein Salmuc_01643 [Salipiger mucosus DSM 16094]|uniref:Uncharacterized protein n=1 Tax=Salipiger mucosus DSM 16094 TaxID=1123237 RepID=S9QW74_9RHOB|nr:hypothetical protein Salmuc_01643 [Salipiger mucosus DSM 16094]
MGDIHETIRGIQKDRTAGWIFRNPDTGTEISSNHPVESGECPDAEDVRPASARELRQEIEDTWEQGAEDQKVAESNGYSKGIQAACSALSDYEEEIDKDPLMDGSECYVLGEAETRISQLLDPQETPEGVFKM